MSIAHPAAEQSTSLPPLRKPGLLGIAAFVMGIAVAPQASAQVYFRGWAGPVYAAPFPGPYGGSGFALPRERRLHPEIVLGELEDQGFQDVVLVSRRPDVYVIEGTSPRRERMRFIVDAFDGEVLERFNQGQAPSARSNDAAGRPAGTARPTAGATPLPVPPRRNAQASLPAPVPQPPRAATTRAPVKDWAPINAVPVAPLD